MHKNINKYWHDQMICSQTTKYGMNQPLQSYMLIRFVFVFEVNTTGGVDVHIHVLILCSNNIMEGKYPCMHNNNNG